MSIIVKLWEFIRRLFCGRKIAPKPKPKPKPKTKSSPREHSGAALREPSNQKEGKPPILYTLTKEDWDLLKEQNYFENLASGMTCKRARDPSIIGDNRIKVLNRDPIFAKKRYAAYYHPDAVKHRRAYHGKFDKTNERIVKVLVDFKKGKHASLRIAFKKNHMDPQTFYKSRTAEEQKQMHDQADAIILAKTQKPKKKVKKVTKAPNPKKVPTPEPVPEPIPEPVPEPVPVPTPKKRKFKNPYTKWDINRVNRVIGLVSSGVRVVDAWEKVGITKYTFYLVIGEHPELNEQFKKAKVKRTAVEKALKSAEEATSPVAPPAPVVTPTAVAPGVPELTQEELDDNEKTSIINRGKATTELVDRIELSLIEHSYGMPLKDALTLHKVEESKYYQFRRLNIGNIVPSVETAETQYKRSQSHK